jgi:hypothetical protein
MPPHQQPPPFQQQQYHSSGLSPQSSAAPLIPADQRQDEQSRTTEGVAGDIDPKTGRRRLTGSAMQSAQQSDPFGQSNSTRDTASPIMSDTSAAMPGALPPSPLKEPPTMSYRPVGAQSIPASPVRQQYNNSIPAPSPSRLRSSSPRQHSPASSEIFERSVHEPVPLSTLQNELSPAHIPNHVLTEDHIPAALEASAEAITSSNLNADEVEIVTATFHQPAAASLESSITGDVSSPHGHHLPSLMHQASDGSEPASLNAASSGFLPLPTNLEDESAGSYGALDPNDVRRLSFISFADVVHSEHAHPATTGDIAGSRDSLHIASQPSGIHERTSSPLRTPRSPSSTYSGDVATPPLTLGPSHQAPLSTDQSPARGVTIGSPGAPHSGTHGDLTIQTMRQALRKTASGDLSGVRSAGLSPVTSTTSEDAHARQNRGRTNT